MTTGTKTTDTTGRDYCEPGLIRAALLQMLHGPGPHPLLQSQAELILYEGQYLLHWVDQHGQDQFKFLSAQHVREAFAEQEIVSGWLPPCVQQWGMNAKGTWMLQWMPAGRQIITLTGKSMPEEPISIPLPALVFAGVGTTYYVWAAKDEDFAPSLPLYRAPFPNVRTDGSICFGTNQPPEVSSTTFPAAWQVFISSPFNGDLAQSKSTHHQSDVRHQLCAARKKQRYPVSDLQPATDYLDREPITVAQAVERYLLPKGER